jgi:hypothetical protein
MRGSGKENARLISYVMMKMKKGGFSVTLCDGNVELMAKRKSVHIYVGKVVFEQVSGAQSRSIKDENLFNPLNTELNPLCYLLALLGAHHILHVSRIRVKLDGGEDELEISINKRGVNVRFEQQEIVQIHIFCDCYGQIQYFRYTCPCQIPAYGIIYDPETLSYFMTNLVFKCLNSLLARLMD